MPRACISIVLLPFLAALRRPLRRPPQPGDTDSEDYITLVEEAKNAGNIPRRGHESNLSWMQRDAASAQAIPTATRFPGMLLRDCSWSQYDWAYCSHTGKEKPPRAHYDHVSSHHQLDFQGLL